MFPRLAIVLVLLAGLSASPAAAAAAIVATGDVSPTTAPSTWTSSTTAYIGNNSAGALTVNSGSDLLTGSAYLGYNSAATGTVTVDGAGSAWNYGSSLYVGDSGGGTIAITNGGAVSGTGSSYINNYSHTATCRAAIDGFGSTWTNGGSFYVGAAGSGTIAITNGGALSNTVGMLGEFSGSTGTATVNGPGSKWTSTSNLDVGDYGSGTLEISGGGAVMATSVAIDAMIAAPSLLAIDVGRGSSLTVGAGSGTIMNESTVRLVAGANAAAGSVDSPISAGTWSGNGGYQAVGGTWNASSHAFTVSQAVSGTAAVPVSIDPSQKQRMLISAAGADDWLGASFLAATSSSTLSLTASPASGAALSSLKSQLTGGASVLSGWTFSTSGYTSGNPAYLSLSIGGGYSRHDLDVWSYNGSAWSPFGASDLTFDGTFASFTVSALNGCGYAIADAPLLPGDANGDGRVDINDLTIVLANFGQTGMTWSQGEFTGDGTVDINDLTIVLANFGLGTGSSADGLAAVPEPSALVLVGLGVVSLVGCTCRRRK